MNPLIKRGRVMAWGMGLVMVVGVFVWVMGWA